MSQDGTRITLARRGELQLVTDPVCGMKVDPRSARGGSFVHAGTTYSFCNPGCRERFAKDPDHWLKAGPRAAASMLPHEAAGSCTPSPRNDNTTSPRM